MVKELLTSALVLFAAATSYAQTSTGGPGSASPGTKSAPNEPPHTTGATGATGGQPEMGTASDTIVRPRVFFESPKDGATVPKTFVVKASVQALKTDKAGAAEPGKGHFHVIIDAPPLKKGEVIPRDKNHIHLLDGQSETKVTLTPGEHTLTLQFGDGTHRAYGEGMNQTIKVTVK